MPKNYVHYSEEIAEEICYVISLSNKGLKTLCKLNPHWPDRANIKRWIITYPEFRACYARAKCSQIEDLIDEIIEIADDTSQDYISNEDGKKIADKEHIHRSKLKIDTRKWLASKLIPKIYGDKIQVDSSNSNQDDIKEALKIALKLKEDQDGRSNEAES